MSAGTRDALFAVAFDVAIVGVVLLAVGLVVSVWREVSGDGEDS